MTVPSTGSPDSAAASMRRHAFSKRARFLDLVVRVDGLANRKLVGGDDPLALVADVDEDLVVVDANDDAGDDLALLEEGERRVVVRDDLSVDLKQQAVGSLDDLRF
jgi:hypothetical protein